MPNSNQQTVAVADKNFNGNVLLEADPVLEAEDTVGIEGMSDMQNLDSNTGSGRPWRNYECKKCNTLFTKHGRQSWHQIQMHRPHKCQKCDMVFIGRQAFAQHIHEEHPGLPIYKAEKSFVCEYCSRTFADEARLQDHISTVHLGAVEHRCDQCGKVLGSAMTLRIHQRQIHQLTCQQTCDGCGLQFARLDGLISHLRREHPHLVPDKYRRRLDELICKKCNLTFSRYGSLQRHIEARHGGVPKYTCAMCSRRFRCRRYVMRHFRIHHPSAIDIKRSSVIDVSNGDESSVSDILQQPAVDSSDVQL